MLKAEGWAAECESWLAIARFYTLRLDFDFEGVGGIATTAGVAAADGCALDAVAVVVDAVVAAVVDAVVVVVVVATFQLQTSFFRSAVESPRNKTNGPSEDLAEGGEKKIRGWCPYHEKAGLGFVL